MCGICGNLNLSKSHPIDAGLIDRMIFMLRHRGPDEFGRYIDADIGLGHARLSIIDLAGGRQPISNEDGTVWVVYNGEIFNYVELRQSLEAAGHRFSTRTDTEVLVHLYEEKGERLFADLNGQFAFALWDTERRRLILARDRVGIRPLFYAEADGSLLFASEVKSLFADPRLVPAIDPAGLDEFFTFWAMMPPRTAFKNVRELPPAHYLIAEKGAVQVRRYWELSFPGQALFKGMRIDEGSYAEQFHDLIMDAVRIRLRADVPVASYLSGGIDSSFISAVVKKYFNPGLRTFSVAFADRQYDESAFQRHMAEYLGTDHRTIACSYGDIGEVMPEVVWHAEKPLVRTAPAPLYLLAKLVRENNIKVVLTGEGADEVLAGYDLFREARIRRFWARFPGSRFRSFLLKDLYQYVPDWPRRAPAYLEAFYRRTLTDTGRHSYSHLPRWETTARTKAYFSTALREELGGIDRIAAFEQGLPDGFGSWDPLSRAQYIETVTLLSGNLLSSQGDRMMMAHSVEGRLPFLDYRVIEFCAALPPSLKLRVLTEKYLLKKVAAPYLPAEIRQRKKQAYRAPDSASFFHGPALEYVAELVSEKHVAETGYFDPAAVRSLARKCADAGRPLSSTRDNIAIVGIITTLLLDHQFVRGRRAAVRPAGAEVYAVEGNSSQRGDHHATMLPMRSA